MGSYKSLQLPGSKAVTSGSPYQVSVPTSYVKALLSEVEARGLDSQALLAAVGIEVGQLEEPQFSALPYGLLYQQAMQALQDEWFGLFSGGRIHRGSFRLLTLLALHSRTLRESMMRSRDFCRVCRGFKISGDLLEGEEVTLVRLAPLYTTPEGEFERLLSGTNPVSIHATLTAWHHFYCWLVGVDMPLTRVFFSFPESELKGAMANLHAAQILFDQPFNGYEFSSQFLDYPIVRAENCLEEFLRLAPLNLLVKVGESQSLADKVNTLLNQNVGAGMLSAEQAAGLLNMSSTKMRRLLQAEGTSFQKLKDEVRMSAAFHYLNCDELSNRDVADKLGFEEISAFFRAFRKWTGVTPGQYRAEQKRAAGLVGNN